MQSSTTGKRFWARAVWKEGDKEMTGVVPELWIKENRLYWPPVLNAKKYMEEFTPPIYSRWRNFPLVKVKIRSEHKCVCEEDEDSEVSEVEKRVVKPKLFPEYENWDDVGHSGLMKNVEMEDLDDSEADEESQISLPPPPKVPRCPTGKSDYSVEPTSPTCFKTTSASPSASPIPRFPSPSHPVRSPMCLSPSPSPPLASQKRFSPNVSLVKGQAPQNLGDGFPLTEAKFQKKVLHALIDMKNLMERIVQQSLHSKVCVVEKISSTEDLEKFEEKLLNDEKEQQNLNDQLKSLGGVNLQDFVRRCMQRLMSNKLMAQFSLKGSKGKLSFCNLVIYNVIKEAAISSYGATEHGVDEIISMHLRYAPDRRGGGGRKQEGSGGKD